MSIPKTLTAGLIDLALGFLLNDPQDSVKTPAGGITLFGLTQAQAAAPRRAARRTARRTTWRTTARLTTLPAGCRRQGTYYYCNGIHYQGIVQGGSTVYVVVTP